MIIDDYHVAAQAQEALFDRSPAEGYAAYS